MSLIFLLLSALVILVNPYGFGLWREVLNYFSFSFYKSHIGEWTPSYAYPIFLRPILFAMIGTVGLVIGWKQKWIQLADITFFIALVFSAFLYKRQALFIVLISVAVLAKLVSQKNIQDRFQKISDWLGINWLKFLFGFIAFALFLEIIFFTTKINYNADIWGDSKTLENVAEPYKVVKFLQQYTTNKQVKIFNEFDWGGYMNWALPNSLVYLDGRGTATWIHSGQETELEHYFYLYNNENGLKELEQDNVDYVFIRQPKYSLLPPPDTINRIIFHKFLSQISQNPGTSTLFAALAKSNQWEQMYSDQMVVIWKRK